MKKLFAILLLLLPVLSQAQIISGKEFRFVPKTQPSYMAYPGDSSVIMVNRATGKFFRTHVAGGGGGSVSSVFGRTGAVTATAADYQSYYPLLSQSYFNPSWINKISQSKVINQNTFSQVSSYLNSYIFEQKNASFFEAGYRDGGGALTINGPTGDTILFAGGWTSPATVYDSVFYSVDGGVTKTFLWLAPWGAMHSFAFFQGDDGYYYKIGGDYLSTDAQKRAVWRSSNPTVRTSWTQVGTLPGMATILFGAAEINGIIYKFGGQKTVNWSDGATDTVWKSTDNGVNWVYHSHGSGIFNKNISGCITKANGKIYIVAGGRYDEATPGNRTFEKTVYETADFITYKQLPSIPEGVQYPSVCYYDNRLFCIGGFNGSANTNNVLFFDGSNKWYVSPNYDSARLSISTTHASAITIWRDKIILLNGNNFNKTYWLTRSRFFSNSTGDITFLNPISTDTITTNPLTGITYVGSKYSGSWVELFNFNGILNRVYSKRNFWVDNTKITIGNNSQSEAQIWMEISGNPNNIIATNANGIDIYHGNTLYWRFQYNGPFRMREIADPGNPPTNHTYIYPSTDGKIYFENNGGGKFDLTGRSFPTVSTGDVAYSIVANDIYIFCDEITANRVLTLPAAASNPGRVIKIWNKNSAAFTWSFSTAVKDASSADVTNLNNDSWYELTSDGTNWNIISRNKTVFSVASTASLTINADDYESAVVTALAANLTINAPTGTPINGQTTLLFRIKDNGTSRTLTFNAVFRAIGVTLPAATTIGKTMYIGAIWNGTDSKYDVVSVNEEL